MGVTRKRAALLRELEGIVGRSFFNSKTQNWGPGGRFEGESRDIRYPITFTDKSGGTIKRRHGYDDITPADQMTGRYVCGVNELHVMQSLEDILQFLEKNYSLKL